jgi:hypothetical protein
MGTALRQFLRATANKRTIVCAYTRLEEFAMRKLSKRNMEIVELLAQGVEPKSHCGEIVHYTRVLAAAFDPSPQKTRRTQQP